MALIDLKHTVIAIRDGAATPNLLEIKIGEGTLTYSEKRNMEYRKDRGVLDTVRQGDEEQMEVNIDFEWEFLRSDGTEEISPEEALKKVGAAAAWVSSSADVCEPYCVDIVITYTPPCSEAKEEVIVLQDFRWETMDHNLKDAQVSCKGACNVVEALITRVAQADMALPLGEMSTADAAKGNVTTVDTEFIRNVGRERINPRSRKLIANRERRQREFNEAQAAKAEANEVAKKPVEAA